MKVAIQWRKIIYSLSKDQYIDKNIRRKKKIMLMSALRVLVNNSFYENFDTNFMGNEKSN